MRGTNKMAFQGVDFIFKAIWMVHTSCTMAPLYWIWLGRSSSYGDVVICDEIDNTQMF